MLVQHRDELRQAVAAARAAGKSIGLVPTMGALHAGHLSLVQAAVADRHFTVVTIFVNPTQFGPNEDFEKYPRDLAGDLEALRQTGVDLVYAPTTDEVYSEGFATFVEPGGVALPLEGARRPIHFRGVATVVLKLFNQVAPDVAYFGRKDYQQTLVVRQMIRDLDLPVRIVVCPTVREPDGLALSSRNKYLNPEERRQATALFRCLRLADELVDSGERDTAKILAQMRALLATAPLVREDYLVLADPETLVEVQRIERPTLAAIAAFVGTTRLIDNATIGQWLPGDSPTG
jgi:pantoate--beta-alanine ligase